jgi:hypothetical protein
MNKVSKESIENKIVDKIFKKLSGKLTHCTLILENGFEVTGESACVDPANYDKVIGEQIAYENAFEKIWEVEGYLLQEKLYFENNLQAEIDNETYGYFKDGEEIDRPIGTRLRELSPATVVPFTESLLLTASTQKIKQAFSREYPVTPEQAFLHDCAITNKKPYGEQLTNNEFNNHLNDLRKSSFNQDYKSHLIENKVTFSDGTVIKFDKMNSIVAHKIFDELLKETGFGSYTIRKMMFDKIFPKAPKMAYEIANGQVYVEKISHLDTDNWEYDLDIVLAKQEPGNVVNAMLLDGVKVSYNRTCKMVNLDIRDSNVREIIIKRMYPESTKGDFIKLENSQAVANEPSFIEKYEKIMEPVITDHKPCTTIKIDNERNIKFNKLCRQELDIIIQELKGSKRKSPERSTAIRKAIEATMWLGMDLKAIGTPNPYPESKNPNNTTVEPTADGLKM